MSEPQPPGTLDFHYEKSSSYRNIHADGAIGGRTASGNVFLSFYLERVAVPDRVRHQITPDGQLGPVVETSGKPGIVREVECGIVMDFKSAVSMRDWLTHLTSEPKAK